MQVSQSVVYALQAAIQLAEAADATPVTRGHLAARGRMPERFLLGILRDLVKHRILRSSRGGGGGFTLARNPDAISLLDIVEAVDGPLPFGLPVDSHFPGQAAQWLQEELEQIAEDCRTRLASISLRQLAAPVSADNPLPCPRSWLRRDTPSLPAAS